MASLTASLLSENPKITTSFSENRKGKLAYELLLKVEIPYEWEKKIKHSLQGYENLSLTDHFKNLEEKPERENSKKQYLLAVAWTVTNGIIARHRVMCQ